MSNRTLKSKIVITSFLKKQSKESASFLVDWLNRPEEKEPEDALAQIQELKAAIVRLSDLLRKSRLREPFDLSELGPVNDMLARYKWITQYLPTTLPGHMVIYSKIIAIDLFDDLLQGLEKGEVTPSLVVASGAKSFIHTLSRLVVDLASNGTLELIRKCAFCGKWFLAKRRDRGFFCCEEHQQAAYKRTPEFKAHAKEYQREYYRDWLSPVTGKFKRRNKRGKK